MKIPPQVMELLHHLRDGGSVTTTDVSLDRIDHWIVRASSLGLLKGRIGGWDPFIKYTLTNKGGSALGLPPLSPWQRLFGR